jgi:hypothetical protein
VYRIRNFPIPKRVLGLGGVSVEPLNIDYQIGWAGEVSLSRSHFFAWAGRRFGRSSAVIAAVFICAILTVPQLPQLSSSSGDPRLNSDDPVNDVNNVQYVNFTNPSWNWTAWFYNVSFPQGSWERIELTLTLINHGDPWDRANVVGVNSVIILEMTTKENGTVLINPVQAFTQDVTVYANLFNESATVYWSPMPNWVGDWNCSLTFAFYPGTPPFVFPEVVPAIFHRHLSASNTTSVNVTFPAGITSAKAVLIERGGNNEEFWFANVPPTIRDFTLDINGTRVFDITGFPFMNSGACLNPPNCWTLYEWNGTPPPGTGLRPHFEIDISPYVSLLNGTQPITFGIGNGGNYWKISLSFLVWRNPRLTPYILDSSTFQRSVGLSGTEQYLESNSTGHRSVTNGVETIAVAYKAWLNASFPVDTHSIGTVSRTITSSTVTVSFERREEIYHNVSRDGSGAGDVTHIIRHSNTTTSSGNGQDYVRIDNSSAFSFIDGDNGGRQSVQTRLWGDYSFGNYSSLGISWEHASMLWRNRTSNLGTGVDEPPYLYEDLSGTPRPFPAILFVEPASNSVMGDPETVFEFVFADDNIVNASLSIGNVSCDITGAKNFTWNSSAAYGPFFTANATATNVINVTSHNELLLRGTKWRFTIDFTAADLGWRFISVPIQMADDSVENVLSSIEGKYSALRYYEAWDPGDPWKTYHTSKPYPDLLSIDSRTGFWINITAPANLDVTGPLPNVTSILLRRGWNMVGFPSLVDGYTVADLIADTGAIAVEGYADTQPYHLSELPGSHVMKQGEGYWIELPATTDWFVPSL